jgi:transcriptional regulator with XRE-family HTH domain
MTPQQFGDRIRKERKAKGLTLQQIADTTSASDKPANKGHISRIEAGKVDISLTKMNAILKALDLQLTISPL